MNFVHKLVKKHLAFLDFSNFCLGRHFKTLNSLMPTKTLLRSKNYPPAEMEKRMRGIRCHVTSESRRYLIVTKSKQEPQIGYHKCSNYLDWVRCHVCCNN